MTCAAVQFHDVGGFCFEFGSEHIQIAAGLSLTRLGRHMEGTLDSGYRCHEFAFICHGLGKQPAVNSDLLRFVIMLSQPPNFLDQI